MKNKLDLLFERKPQGILNIYCTAGYPHLESTTEVIMALQTGGADIIEIGMPYSDPIADGPVIQQSNMQALANGISIEKLFQQLRSIKAAVQVPLVLMGYLNPVLQYGIHRFCEEAAACGISGVILPDCPVYEYEKFYKEVFEESGLHVIFLITPETSDARIRKADALSGGFLYAVSASSTTGTIADGEKQQAYFERLGSMKINNPVLIGFGIKDKSSFRNACTYASGAIIGTAFIQALSQSDDDVRDTVHRFLESIQG